LLAADAKPAGCATEVLAGVMSLLGQDAEEWEQLQWALSHMDQFLQAMVYLSHLVANGNAPSHNFTYAAPTVGTWEERGLAQEAMMVSPAIGVICEWG